MTAIYDLDALREQKKRIEESIENIAAALSAEQKKLARTEMMIEDAEKIMDSHDLPACKRGVGEHDWRITERHIDGPNRGKWKTRYCAKCKESQAVGHGARPKQVVDEE